MVNLDEAFNRAKELLSQSKFENCTGNTEVHKDTCTKISVFKDKEDLAHDYEERLRDLYIAHHEHIENLSRWYAQECYEMEKRKQENELSP